MSKFAPSEPLHLYFSACYLWSVSCLFFLWKCLYREWGSQLGKNAGWRQLFQGIFTGESSWKKAALFLMKTGRRQGGWIQVSLSYLVFLAWPWSSLLALRAGMFSQYTLAIPTGSRVWDLGTESIPRGLFLLISRPHLPDRTSELGSKKHLRPGTWPGAWTWGILYYFQLRTFLTRLDMIKMSWKMPKANLHFR